MKNDKMGTCGSDRRQDPKPKIQRGMGDETPGDTLDDIFDACLNLEQSYYESGYERGREEGRVLGRDEGRILGMKEGWDIGFELGLYLGVAEALRSQRGALATTSSTAETTAVENKRKNASERKLARLVDGVYDSLTGSSLGRGGEVDEGSMRRGDVHPRNDELHAYVQEVRAKFKMIAAMVGEEDRQRISTLVVNEVQVGGL